MAFTPGNKNGNLSGINFVSIVDPPAASAQRMVRTLLIYNPNVLGGALEVRVKEGPDGFTFFKDTLGGEQTFLFGENDEVIVLDTTAKSIEARISGIGILVQPSFISSWADRS